jgi:hypothetical protein
VPISGEVVTRIRRSRGVRGSRTVVVTTRTLLIESWTIHG